MQNTFKVIWFSDANSDLTNSICLSSGMVGFDGKNEIFPFLYYTINSFDFHHKKDQYCTWATQRALTNDGLSEIKILIPKDDVISKFWDIFYISIQEILTLKKQNANLKQTRNLLLPKLISWELDVENLDIKI
jgi:type I restriction enzyme S subunit